MTDKTVIVGGTIYYDAACGFCSGWAERLAQLLSNRNFHLAPLASAGPAVADEMILGFSDGRRYGGADAILAIAECIWWLRPFAILAKFPGVLRLLRALYRI